MTLQYYQRPFALFHAKIGNTLESGTEHLRKKYWNSVSNGIYNNTDAQDLFWAYANSLEERSVQIISNYSIAYWLHLSRRIGINSGGDNKDVITINTNRLNILALIQKYGRKDACGYIKNSKEIEISEIFNGLLISSDFEAEKKLIELAPAQFVLTNFNHENILEYYLIEKIAYELWICGAKLRAIGKGALIVVDNNSRESFIEERDQLLSQLISSYDDRLRGEIASETGTVFKHGDIDKDSEIFIPVINAGDIPISYMNPFFNRHLGINISENWKSNFIILPYAIKKYLKAHLPFENDFIKLNEVNYRHIIILISALCYRFFYLSVAKRDPIILNLAMRGYEGPSKKESIINEALHYSIPICEILNESPVNKEDITKAFEYLENKDQNKVNIFDHGTLKMFLDSNSGYYYIDYSVIPSILQSLFNRIPLNLHGFRGDLLEEAIEIQCHLPTTPCKGLDNTSRQIDFSYLIGDVLIIGECKVVARRQSFFNGSYQAIKLRETKVIEKGLAHVDDKAHWLLNHPIGKNYNITKIKNILPIAISPFVEFINSKDRKYWINETTPRVLSLSEFINFIKTFEKNQVSFNLLAISNQ